MATTTAPLMVPRQRPPSHPPRRLARELARLDRAERIYQRHSGVAAGDRADAYCWYAHYLADNFPAPGWEG